MPITLTGLRRYPVKSCRGEDLAEAIVERWGLAGDRRWMVVDETDRAVTAREVHRMLQIVPEPVPGGLRLNGPGVDPLVVTEPAAPSGEVEIWDDVVPAGAGGSDADAWLSAVLGLPVRLVFLDDPLARPISRRFAEDGDVVSFADAYPLLLATEDSLSRLNDWIADGPRPEEGPLAITRFRPNLIVSGALPFAEDGWVRIRIGDATFRVVKGCDRCVLTTLDPQTGEKQMEPITSLARHRRWDGKTWFATNVIPDTPGATLRLGDEVEVLETRDASDGPVR